MFICGCQQTSVFLFLFLTDKVEKVNVNLDDKTVTITSNLSSDELLEQLRKSGKPVTYVGVKK